VSRPSEKCACTVFQSPRSRTSTIVERETNALSSCPAAGRSLDAGLADGRQRQLRHAGLGV